MLLTPSFAKSTNYIGYLTLLRLTKARNLTLIYGGGSANALVSLLRCLYSFTIKLRDNRKTLTLV